MKNGNNSLLVKTKNSNKKKHELKIQNILQNDTDNEEHEKKRSRVIIADSLIYAPSPNELPRGNTAKFNAKLMNVKNDTKINTKLSPNSNNLMKENRLNIDVENMEEVLFKIQVLKTQLQHFEYKFRNRVSRQQENNEYCIDQSLHGQQSGDFNLLGSHHGVVRRSNQHKNVQNGIGDASKIADPVIDSGSSICKNEDIPKYAEDQNNAFPSYSNNTSSKTYKNLSNESIHTYFEMARNSGSASKLKNTRNRENQTENFTAVLEDLKTTAEDLQKKICVILQEIKLQNDTYDSNLDTGRVSEKSLLISRASNCSMSSTKSKKDFLQVFDQRHKEILNILKALEDHINSSPPAATNPNATTPKSKASDSSKKSDEMKKKQSFKILDSVVFSHDTIGSKSKATSSEENCPTCGGRINESDKNKSKKQKTTKKSSVQYVVCYNPDTTKPRTCNYKKGDNCKGAKCKCKQIKEKKSGKNKKSGWRSCFCMFNNKK